MSRRQMPIPVVRLYGVSKESKTLPQIDTEFFNVNTPFIYIGPEYNFVNRHTENVVLYSV